MSSGVAELVDYLNADEQHELDRLIQRLKPKPRGAALPTGGWRSRVPTLFPRFAKDAFAARHAEFWGWVDVLELDSNPDPFCAFWPRGGAKSTSAEMAVADLGVRGKRRYGLYVRMTQDMADKSVENIAALLESDEIAHYFPEHAERQVNKFGQSKGWRRNRLRTAGGFTVDALGLDTASRGIKVEDQRPDFIIFDDIDDKHDGPHITKRKMEIITHSILPAGSNNVAVLFIQNLIIADGIATRLADGRADFLVKRRVSGPFPAVENLKVEWQADPTSGTRRATITGGTASWEGQPLAACQSMIDRFGLTAFMKECQHKVKGRGEGVALRFDDARHAVTLSDDECRQLVAMGRVFGGIDFGHWRFGFTLWAVDQAGVPFRIDEVFSQAESLTTRAQRIHEMCEKYGIVNRMVPIWGDAANPSDIVEINQAFKRGWVDEDGRHVTSKLRVIAVGMKEKTRAPAITRINDMLDRNAIRFRRGVNTGVEWFFGRNAGSDGTSMTGSRLLWEIDAWSFLIPKEGEAQAQDADDHTADGADMISTMRYALMSWWKAAKTPHTFGIVPEDQAQDFDYRKRKFVEPKHAIDFLMEGTSARRAPGVRMPRPRSRR